MESKFLKKSCQGFYNKYTAFYWEKTAQIYYDEETGYSCIARIAFAAMYEAWHDHREHDHFLAHPVRITLRGPKNWTEIVEAHKQMCTVARERMLMLDNYYYRVHNIYAALLLVYNRCDYEGIKADSEGFFGLSEVAWK